MIYTGNNIFFKLKVKSQFICFKELLLLVTHLLSTRSLTRVIYGQNLFLALDEKLFKNFVLKQFFFFPGRSVKNRSPCPEMVKGK